MSDTLLGNRIAANAAPSTTPPPVPATKLERRLAEGQRGRERTIPWFGKVYIELVGSVRWKEIWAAVRLEMTGDALQLDSVNAEQYEVSRARRVLALAFRDPDDHAKPFGMPEQWEGLDPDLINTGWNEYGDVRDMLNPMEAKIDDDDRLIITSAVKKKDEILLRSFGARTLARWLVTTDGLLSTSREQRSTSTEESSESSDQ